MYAILITGAALVGLPIILHLIMKQEPKRLLFPAVRFLRQKQRTNQRKMRLRNRRRGERSRGRGLRAARLARRHRQHLRLTTVRAFRPAPTRALSQK